MQNGRRIADRLRRAHSGPMWHGPAVGELLVGAVGAMPHDVIEHTSYHGGQIALLKRAL